MISRDLILRHINNCLRETHFEKLGPRYQGKVRDVYDLGDRLAIIVTDRQSAFDQVLAEVPFKGQVLNQITNYWFRATQDIVQNHLLSEPDPNVSIVKKCTRYNVEIVVRGYITGVTNTSAWYNYERGERVFCGVTLPDGLRKNQRFDHPIITPTTKPDIGHDEKISAEEIVSRRLVPEDRWREIERVSLALFERGAALAAKQGLIFVDTKYEMGFDEQKNLVLIDEIHTPDSSRFWIASSYEERWARGEEPESLDKEFLRIWLKEHGFVYDHTAPEIPDTIRAEFAEKYIRLYETITGQSFVVSDLNMPILERIETNLRSLI